MKLSRHDLVHAKDVQLKSIGLNRKLNKGWLRRALQSDFTEEEIAVFHKAAEKTITTETVVPTLPNRRQLLISAKRAIEELSTCIDQLLKQEP